MKKLLRLCLCVSTYLLLWQPREYEPVYFYWEAVECLRKAVLMGFAVFFQPGSLMQLVLVMVLTGGYTVLLASLHPYKSEADDSLAITQQVLLFFTLLGGLMVKFQRGFRSTGLYEEGYSEEFISAMLTTRCVCFC